MGESCSRKMILCFLLVMVLLIVLNFGLVEIFCLIVLWVR